MRYVHIIEHRQWSGGVLEIVVSGAMSNRRQARMWCASNTAKNADSRNHKWWWAIYGVPVDRPNNPESYRLEFVDWDGNRIPNQPQSGL